MNAKDRTKALREAAEKMSEIADRDLGEGKFGEPVMLSFETALRQLHDSIEKYLKSVILDLECSPHANHDLKSLMKQLNGLGETPPTPSQQIGEIMPEVREWGYDSMEPTSEDLLTDQYQRTRKFAEETRDWSRKRRSEIAAARENPAQTKTPFA